MASNSFICIPLIIFTIANQIESKQYGSPIKKETECSKEGMSCIDCWRSLNCIDLGNGEFYPQVQNCPVGRSCKNSTGNCEENGNYQCDNEILVNRSYCTSEGVFPDPYNCQKYFHCLQDDGGLKYDQYNRKCPESLAFDPLTNQCTKHFNGTCESPVVICKNDTQVGKILENSNIYYKCVRQNVSIGYNFLPQLYSCPHNYYFDGEICRDSFYSGKNQNGVCETVGMFLNSTSDCRYYNRCTVIGESPIYSFCNFKFSPAQRSCVSFTCDTCKG